MYYTPLLKEPLPSLNGQSVSDLISVLHVLGIIAEKNVDIFPKDYTIKSIDEIAVFSPLVSRKSLINVITQATEISRNNVSTILEALEWSQGKDLWFHPLISANLENGSGFMFAMLPLVSPNLYRSIDYWLANLGLPIERRGYLFEQQIEQELLEAAYRGGVSDGVVISGSRSLKSDDDSTEEQIDSLILLHDLLVIGEAKCQVLPTTPLDTKNYLKNLSDGASQAKRKAQWAGRHLDIIARALGVDVERFSGKVEPIVVTNHSVGAGLVFHNVPVLDLRLLKNYSARPYLSQGRFSAKGFEEIQKTPRFYSSLREMADRFHTYATGSFFLSVYTEALEPQWKEFLLRHDEKVVMLQYMANQ